MVFFATTNRETRHQAWAGGQLNVLEDKDEDFKIHEDEDEDRLLK